MNSTRLGNILAKNDSHERYLRVTQFLIMIQTTKRGVEHATHHACPQYPVTGRNEALSGIHLLKKQLAKWCQLDSTKAIDRHNQHKQLESSIIKKISTIIKYNT